jgi:hypothetical protein
MNNISSMSDKYRKSKRNKKIRGLILSVLFILCSLCYCYNIGIFDSFIQSDNQYIESVVEKNGKRIYNVEVNRLGNYRKEVKSIVKQLFPKGNNLSDLEKYQVLHDFVKEYISYDYKALMSGNESISEANDSKNCLRKQKGVCGGYAYMYRDLCKAAGLQCEVIIGNAYFQGKKRGHAWNGVKLDGKWYHVDVCWDDTGAPAYEFFLIGSDGMNTTTVTNRTWSSTQCSFNYKGVARGEIKKNIIVYVTVKG